MWTQFWDMHSGGGTKEAPYEKIYIEAPEQEAKVIFYNRFGHNPERVSCTCCGEDYSISESETLEQATAYHRNCEWGYFDKYGNVVPESEAFVRGKGLKKGYTSGYIEKIRQQNLEIRQKCKTPDADEWGLYKTLKEYKKQKDVLVIYKKDIKSNERIDEVPTQGYVWAD